MIVTTKQIAVKRRTSGRVARPIGGHPVPRQIARHDVQQPGHRGRPGEPEDQDRADVVDRPEEVAELFVGEVRQRAPVGRATRQEGIGRDRHGRHDTAGTEQHAHDQRGGGQELARVADPPLRGRLGVARIALNQQHHDDPGLEAGEAERQLGEEEQRRADHQQRATIGLREPRAPIAQELRLLHDLHQTGTDHHDIERQIDRHDPDRDADRLAETLEEDRAQQRDQRQGDRHLQAVQEQGVRVLDQVGGGVGGGEGDGDHEAGRHEAEQRQHEELALPPRQEPFEHRDRAIAVRALARHAPVHRQRAEQGDQHQHQRGERRERPGGQRRDPRLVAERGEVIDPGEAHHLPPGVRMRGVRLLVGGIHLLDLPLQQPAHERARRAWRQGRAADRRAPHTRAGHGGVVDHAHVAVAGMAPAQLRALPGTGLLFSRWRLAAGHTIGTVGRHLRARAVAHGGGPLGGRGRGHIRLRCWRFGGGHPGVLPIRDDSRRPFRRLLGIHAARSIFPVSATPHRHPDGGTGSHFLSV